MSENELHVDDDWKNRADAERRAAALEREQAIQEQAIQEEGDSEIPEATFGLLVNTLAMQAVSALGHMPDPQTGQAMVHKPLAQHMIDLLTVLEDKTKGNLDAEETKMITQILSQLRIAFLQTPDAPPSSPEKPSSIVMP